MAQMVKQSALPIKAMMLSKAGKRIEMTRNVAKVSIREKNFIKVK